MVDETRLSRAVATAVIGMDTIWGGDVMNPSGLGRFIADGWFSDEPLPAAYHHPTAARLRATGGVGAKLPDARAIDVYLDAVDVRGAMRDLRELAPEVGGLRGAYLEGMAESLEVMWALAKELLQRGPEVSYERCVEATTGRLPEPSVPDERRARVAELLGRAGHAVGTPTQLLAAVDTWRAARPMPKGDLRALAATIIAELDLGTRRHVVPHLPAALRDIPRANVQFLPIEDAWFSGSMNYLGRARRADGSPEYDATYEINAALQISMPELAQLVSHEVVPGHVTTFALAQALYVEGRLGFEATVPAMNTRSATLCEGIANNAVLMAYGVREVDELPSEDLRIGVLLALLQDDAKNQSSWLTWRERRPQAEVAAVLRQEYLCSAERADKLSGAWGRHPLMGRMYLPCYRAGTEKVAELRRRHPDAKVVPALYQCEGVVDVVTIDRVLG